MGNCHMHLKKFEPNDRIAGQDRLAMKVFQDLMLTQQEINMFYAAFLDIDSDSSYIIREDELRAYFKIENTKFNRKMLGMIDSGDGYLNFLQFVCSVRELLYFVL